MEQTTTAADELGNIVDTKFGEFRTRTRSLTAVSTQAETVLLKGAATGELP